MEKKTKKIRFNFLNLKLKISVKCDLEITLSSSIESKNILCNNFDTFSKEFIINDAIILDFDEKLQKDDTLSIKTSLTFNGQKKMAGMINISYNEILAKENNSFLLNLEKCIDKTAIISFQTTLIFDQNFSNSIHKNQILFLPQTKKISKHLEKSTFVDMQEKLRSSPIITSKVDNSESRNKVIINQPSKIDYTLIEKKETNQQNFKEKNIENKSRLETRSNNLSKFGKSLIMQKQDLEMNKSGANYLTEKQNDTCLISFIPGNSENVKIEELSEEIEYLKKRIDDLIVENDVLLTNKNETNEELSKMKKNHKNQENELNCQISDIKTEIENFRKENDILREKLLNSYNKKLFDDKLLQVQNENNDFKRKIELSDEEILRQNEKITNLNEEIKNFKSRFEEMEEIMNKNKTDFNTENEKLKNQMHEQLISQEKTIIIKNEEIFVLKDEKERIMKELIKLNSTIPENVDQYEITISDHLLTIKRLKEEIENGRSNQEQLKTDLILLKQEVNEKNMKIKNLQRIKKTMLRNNEMLDEKEDEGIVVLSDNNGSDNGINEFDNDLVEVQTKNLVPKDFNLSSFKIFDKKLESCDIISEKKVFEVKSCFLFKNMKNESIIRKISVYDLFSNKILRKTDFIEKNDVFVKKKEFLIFDCPNNIFLMKYIEKGFLIEKTKKITKLSNILIVKNKIEHTSDFMIEIVQKKIESIIFKTMIKLDVINLKTSKIKEQLINFYLSKKRDCNFLPEISHLDLSLILKDMNQVNKYGNFLEESVLEESVSEEKAQKPEIIILGENKSIIAWKKIIETKKNINSDHFETDLNFVINFNFSVKKKKRDFFICFIQLLIFNRKSIDFMHKSSDSKTTNKNEKLINFEKTLKAIINKPMLLIFQASFNEKTRKSGININFEKENVILIEFDKIRKKIYLSRTNGD